MVEHGPGKVTFGKQFTPEQFAMEREHDALLKANREKFPGLESLIKAIADHSPQNGRIKSGERTLGSNW